MKKINFEEGIALIEEDFFRKLKTKLLDAMEKSDRDLLDQIKLYLEDIDEFFGLSYNKNSKKTYLEVFTEILQEITNIVFSDYSYHCTILISQGKISMKDVCFRISRNELVETDWEFFHEDILGYFMETPSELDYTFSGAIIWEYQYSDPYLNSSRNLVVGDGLLLELAIQSVGPETMNLYNDEFIAMFDNFLYGLTLCGEERLLNLLRRKLMYQFRDFLVEEFEL